MLLLITAGDTAAQSVPHLINYQGGLTDASGNPLETREYKLSFSIFDSPTGGTAVWGPQIFLNVPVVQGHFNVILGPTDSADPPRNMDSAFRPENTYLEITIDDGSPVAPRQQILSAPYALKSAWSVASNYPPGYLDGGVISNGSSDTELRISAAHCRSGDNTTNINVPEMAKSVLSLWEPGENKPALDTGAVGFTQVIIYVWAIADEFGKKSDFLFSKEGGNPTLPAGYTKKRLLGGRVWLGNKWQKFITVGKGRNRWVQLVSPPGVLSQAFNEEDTYLDLSTWVPVATSRNIEISANAYTSNNSVAWMRIWRDEWYYFTNNGGASRGDNLQTAGTGWVFLDEQGRFLFDADATQQLLIRLLGYQENL